MLLRKRHKRTIGVVALLFVLSACTVTPEPLGEKDQADRSKADLEALRSIEFVPTRPIALHEAIARAVAFNLRQRVSQIERNIAEAELDQANYDMLPTLELNANKKRSDVQVSSSDDRISKTADASFTWNLLDLGVSYARARQRADEVLIAREKERKALHDIIRDVNTAFWRAATGQRLMAKVAALTRDLKLAMEASRGMEETRATDVITAVAFRREVVGSVRQALTVQRELNEARSQLGELLNIRPGTEFSLALPAEKVSDFRLPMSVPEMEQHALLHRPELRIEDYNERKGDWEAREAIYRMLPGLDLSVGRNYSSETGNLSPNWISTGMKLSMNIFNLFSGTSEIDAAEQKSELARQQRLAMSLAVLTQLHLARVKFRNAEQQMRLVREIADSDRHLSRLVSVNGEFLNKDLFEAVRIATRQMISEMDEQRTLVDLVAAHTEVMHAIGQDVLPDRIPLNDVPALAGAIRDMTAKWYAAESRGNRPDGADTTPMGRLVDAVAPEKPSTATVVAAPAPRPDGTKTAAGDLPYEELPELATAGGAPPVRTDEGGRPVAEAAVTDGENTAQAAAASDDDAAPAAVAGAATREDAATGTPPLTGAESDDETVASSDGVSGIAEQAARLSEIAPASRGNAAMTYRTPGDWELLPSGVLEPAFAATAPDADPDAGPGPRFVVSLGAFSQQENAFRLHAEIGARSAALLGETPVRVVLRPAGNGSTYYFVQSDPMPDRRSAVTLCRSLERAGRACNVSVLTD